MMLTVACGDYGLTGPQEASLRVRITDCVDNVHVASGFAVTENLVVTAAHPLVNVATIELVPYRPEAVTPSTDGSSDDADPSRHRPVATVAYLDADKDIALLRTDQIALQPMPLATTGQLAQTGESVTVVIIDEDGRGQTRSGTVLRTVDVTLDGNGRRSALELAADIERGHSGAPVVDPDGRATGMVFATARNDDRGWAVAADELASALEAFEAGETRGLDPETASETPPPSLSCQAAPAQREP